MTLVRSNITKVSEKISCKSIKTSKFTLLMHDIYVGFQYFEGNWCAYYFTLPNVQKFITKSVTLNGVITELHSS